MSEVMMAALQAKNESLSRQVAQLAPENERVRKLLTEFDERHDRDAERIEALEAENARLRKIMAEASNNADKVYGENARLRAAVNQSRLAFAGYVSVQSAIDMIDAASQQTP